MANCLYSVFKSRFLRSRFLLLTLQVCGSLSVSSVVFCFRVSYLGRTATNPRDGTRVVHSPELVQEKAFPLEV